jgi:hypothetical protein
MPKRSIAAHGLSSLIIALLNGIVRRLLQPARQIVDPLLMWLLAARLKLLEDMPLVRFWTGFAQLGGYLAWLDHAVRVCCGRASPSDLISA